MQFECLYWSSLGFIVLSFTWFVAHGTTVYEFQKGGVGSKDTYAISPQPLFLDFRNSTLCFWFSVYYLRGADETYGCLMTMSQRTHANSITYCLFQNDGKMALELIYVLYGINPNEFSRGTTVFQLEGVVFRRWYHMCTTFTMNLDELQSDLNLFLDGEKIANWSLKHESRSEETVVELLPVLGQDQDSFGGDFESDQSFSGKLADIRIIDRVINETEFQNMDLCSLEGNWYLFDTWNISYIGILNQTEDSFCKKDLIGSYFVSEKDQDFYQAKEICDLVHGELPLPKTEEEFDEMTETFIEVLAAGNLSLHLGYLVGFKFNPELGKWVDSYTDEAVPENHFISDFRRFEFHCVVRWRAHKDYYPISCTKRVAATYCKIKEDLKIHLKGMCDESKMGGVLFDAWYYVHGVKNGRPHFLGPGQSEIYFDIDDKKWRLESHIPPFINLFMKNSALDITPLGRRTWEIASDVEYLCEQKGNTSIDLSLSTCYPNKFTCDNGECIPLSQRCDTKINCRDSSDEFDCNYIGFNGLYAKEIAPVDKEQEVLNIYMNVSILDIPYIDTYEMKLTTSFILRLRWEDFRLGYMNLNEDHNLNFLSNKDKDNLWTPEIGLNNALGQTEIDFDEKALAKLIRHSVPFNETKEHAKEARFFSGYGNSIFMEEKYFMDVICHFDLANYPFDTQVCSLDFSLLSNSERCNLFIEGSGVDLKREDNLLVEHQIRNLWAKDKGGVNENSAKITIVLRRRMEYHVYNTFLQIAMLLAIGMLSLYFNVDNFSDRVMVTLTTLLVLVTIMSAIQGDLPKTNYFKLIDIWLLFSVSYLGFIMAFHTHLAGMKRPSEAIEENNKLFVLTKDKKENNDSKLTAKIQKRNRRGRIFFFVLLLGFFFGFGLRSMYVYYNSDVSP